MQKPTPGVRIPVRVRWLAAAASALLLATSCTKPAAQIPASDLVQIPELARILADSTATPPALLHVGFAPLFRTGHIPGSRFVGPGNSAQGLASLDAALKALPPDQPAVLYCGCCPWQDCPNVRPAYETAKASGHANVRLLYVTGNMERDWLAQGYPWVKGE